MNKRVLAVAAVMSTAIVPAAAMAELSANIGYASEYIYRGVIQSGSTASAGVDYENNGFYIGTWAADLDLGIETDLYFGYGGETDGGFGYSVGYTGYFYTENDPADPSGAFWDTISEINLGVSYGIFALDVAVGQDDAPKTFGWTTDSVDFIYSAITISPEVGPYYKYAMFGDQYKGSYLELGYSYDFMGVDLGIAFVYNLDEKDTDNFGVDTPYDPSVIDTPITFLAGGGDSSLVFSIGKSFSIGD